MITYESIVKQIEKLTTEAAHAATEQQAREKLAAIRALCDVVLDEKISSPKPASINSMSTTISSPVYTQPVAIPAQKLEEDDANGDSLFDF
ncbi:MULTISPECIES: YwdI family protein [Solibacillus]|uniref:YwdI family protein n=1 Tax=Solibacillus TaxID=648800 RepID=UPI002041D3B0|nr:YwdI family protein [Solibacillus isronensis]MCM3722630.1 YwdI family protein [Solibacillus isronensis]